jgi:hypothetical protein
MGKNYSSEKNSTRFGSITCLGSLSAWKHHLQIISSYPILLRYSKRRFCFNDHSLNKLIAKIQNSTKILNLKEKSNASLQNNSNIALFVTELETSNNIFSER